MNSLIYELPKIIDDGKKEVERILERLSSSNKISLQTNEIVLPSKDSDNLWSGQMPKDENKDWMNRLVYGDNLLTMQALLAGDPASGLPSMRGKIDLIYIDPPFDSKADYRTKINLPGVDLEQKPTVLEQFAYADTWKDGTASYLRMLYPRLLLLKELLSDKGSIYLHIDWHVGHYVKILLDEIFGKDNFRNDIIWWKTRVSKYQSSSFGKVYDDIFFYTKSSDFYFNPPMLPYREGYLDNYYRFTDETTGKKYAKIVLTQAGQGSPKKFGDRIISPPAGKHWIWSQERIDKALEENIIIFTDNGIPNYKKFADDAEGLRPNDLWIDIEPLNPVANERVSFDTQKPEKLLNRIITSSCPENGLILDVFSGSGTTGISAEKLNRRWIMSDIGKPSNLIIRKRLIDQNAKPFLYQAIGDYQKEALASSKLYRRVGDLAQVVMQLFGAIPFVDDQNPNKNLGYIKENRTLVLVDSPSKLTGLATLKKAIEYKNSFMGGWNKVVVLGWNFTYDITEAIQSLNDDNLEVLVIPPDLLDKLKTKASYKDLVNSGKIRFSSLQYLSIKPIKTEVIGEEEQQQLTIELDNYVLLSPDNIPLDDKDKEKLKELIAKDPLSLIEYWSIDPDYDGETFRSKWQDYRENEENDGDPYHVINKAVLTVPKKVNRKICVKAVDVFGFESIVVESL